MTTLAVSRLDLNADGLEDYVLDVGAVGCEGAASIYGDREKAVFVYVGTAQGGATRAFQDWVFGTRIHGAGPAATLWLTVMGEACGAKAAPDFARESFCERAIAWNAGTGTFEYAPVSMKRTIE